MNRYIVPVICLSLSFLFSGVVNASENSDPENPCNVTLCMYGEVTGHSQQECHRAVKKFFSLNAFKKHHRFSPEKTFDMRKNFLSQCGSADPQKVSQILSRYGRVKR